MNFQKTDLYLDRLTYKEPPKMIPKGVGAPPPPGMDPRKGKLMCIKVRMLDDTVGVFHLGHKALGEALFDEVCRHLNLLETDYFGLEFNDCFNNRCWLDKDKPILRQITNKQSDARFYFVVKFYTPNPADLVEEYTRYLIALQIRRDLGTGELRCNYNTAALMAAHIVQSDCGDFNADDYPDHTYLNSGRFIPNQNVEFLKKVREDHMKLIGMSPGESDLALLEIARRCEFYGVKLHEAKDVEETLVGLSVAHMGIRVFHQLQCVSTFSWAKIRKLSFKRRKLLIKLHPESYQYYKETIEFSFENRNECKNFWKKCVEHHAFFRCLEVSFPKKMKENKLFSRGSSFRYHGKTQKQLIDYVREHRKRREPFSRPIRSGLSSQRGVLSKPAHYSISPGYSTVSDRGIQVVTANASRGHEVDSQPCCSFANENGHGTQDAETETNTVDEKPKPEADIPPPSNEPGCTTVAICALSPLEKQKILFEEQFSIFRSDGSSESGAVTLCDDSEAAFKQKPQSSKSDADEAMSKDAVNAGYTASASSTETALNTNFFNGFKDFVMAERTFVRDLKILTQKFFEPIGRELSTYGRAISELFATLKILSNFHQNLLKEVEEKLSEWTDPVTKHDATEVVGICELLLCFVHNAVQHYRSLIQHSPIYVAAIDELAHTNKTFARKIRDFESSSVCYLPLNTMLLNVVFHMVIWQNILGRMVASLLEEDSSSMHNQHLGSCSVAMDKIAVFNSETTPTREGLVNFVIMMEIESELDAVDNIIQPNRKFVREGLLSRWNNNKLNAQLFVAFNDVLVYATLLQDDSNFVINGVIQLRGAEIEEAEVYDIEIDPSTSFIVRSSKNSLILSANSTFAKDIWKDDLSKAIGNANDTKPEHLPQPISAKFYGNEDPTEGSLSSFNLEKNTFKSTETINQTVTKESNKYSALRICWYRQATIGAEAILMAASNQMSGYLLRKFRTSPGWQRLWVVLTNFTMFFYRDHTDDYPLANLNLIDYSISLPLVSDRISKDNVFKISYRKHSYFFRTENAYCFTRWTEAARSATQNFVSKTSLTDLIIRKI